MTSSNNTPTTTRHVCASLDLDNPKALLVMAEKLAPYVMGFKLHSDILTQSLPQDFYVKLRAISRKHNVMLIEDRKFCDIGHIVQKQFAPYQYWADAVTVHVVAGPGTIESLIQVKPNIQIIVVASMSSKDTLTDKAYFEKAVAIGCRYENVIGFVTQYALPEYAKAKGKLTFTPGIRLGAKKDSKDQQYRTPGDMIRIAGTNVAIVGRGIIQAKDPVKAALNYETAFQK